MLLPSSNVVCWGEGTRRTLTEPWLHWPQTWSRCHTWSLENLIIAFQQSVGGEPQLSCDMVGALAVDAMYCWECAAQQNPTRGLFLIRKLSLITWLIYVVIPVTQCLVSAGNSERKTQNAIRGDCAYHTAGKALTYQRQKQLVLTRLAIRANFLSIAWYYGPAYRYPHDPSTKNHPVPAGEHWGSHNLQKTTFQRRNGGFWGHVSSATPSLVLKR